MVLRALPDPRVMWGLLVLLAQRARRELLVLPPRLPVLLVLPGLPVLLARRAFRVMLALLVLLVLLVVLVLLALLAPVDRRVVLGLRAQLGLLVLPATRF